jgi:transcriptional regulator with XRE-family HTH domain
MYYQKTMEFSEWLDKKLKEKGWSRSEAARRGHVSASMFDKVIRDGQEPGRKFIEGLAKAFKMNVAEVMEIATNPTARISEDIRQQSEELISGFEFEDTRRKALAELQRLKQDEERRKQSGTTTPKRSPKPKTT